MKCVHFAVRSEHFSTCLYLSSPTYIYIYIYIYIYTHTHTHKTYPPLYFFSLYISRIPLSVSLSLFPTIYIGKQGERERERERETERQRDRERERGSARTAQWTQPPSRTKNQDLMLCRERWLKSIHFKEIYSVGTMYKFWTLNLVIYIVTTGL